MEEIKHQIQKVIEQEYREALKKGFLDSSTIVNQIWKLLFDKDPEIFSKPEPAYGCYDYFDELEEK